jgi:prevent-host-death family protein
MTETHVSIGRIKRDISDLVNRVAYGGERIVLTSRGKPKAALVSMEDYERLERERAHTSLAQWQAWLEDAEKLAAGILRRRGGVRLDVDALWEKAGADREARDDQVLGR